MQEKVKAKQYDQEERARERLVELERRNTGTAIGCRVSKQEDYWGMVLRIALKNPEKKSSEISGILWKKKTDLSYQIACAAITYTD